MSDADRLEWFPCYPSKLLGALAGLSPSQGYLYWIVCLRIYEVGGPCPDSADVLARRTGMSRRVVEEALCELFKTKKLFRQDGGIMNSFAADVMQESREILAKRSEAGQKGGRASAKKYKQKQQNDASKRPANEQQTSTPLQVDTLFTDVNRADKPPEKPLTKTQIERKELFDRGKEILGESAGGMIQSLLAVKHGVIASARAALEQASTMDNPRQYIGAITRKGNVNGKTEGTHIASAASRLRRDIASRGSEPLAFDAPLLPAPSQAGR